MESFGPTQRSQSRIGKGHFLALGLLLALFLGVAGLAARSGRNSNVEVAFPPELPFSATAVDVGNAGALWLDTANADEVSSAFLREFSKVEPEIEWQGSQAGCDGGTSSPALRAATIDRVNFYRAMAGVPAVISENQEFSRKAQSGAVMMSAQGELSHQPDSSFACFSEFGFEAASNSNLYLGRTGVRAIDGYVEDPGEENVDVGHRNTLLHPPTREMGVANVGSVDGFDEANLLWVFDDLVFVEESPTRSEAGFVAWPPPGFVPQEVVYPRWSFSLRGASFADAQVAVRSGDKKIAIKVVKIDGKIGRVPNPIIVWEPELDVSSEASSFEVEIRDVEVAGELRTFSYRTTLLEPLL